MPRDDRCVFSEGLGGAHPPAALIHDQAASSAATCAKAGDAHGLCYWALGARHDFAAP